MSASRYRAWHRCNRYHDYQYEQRYQAIKEAKATAFGTMFHRALEAWWMCWQSRDGDLALPVSLERIADGAPDELDDVARLTLDVLVRGYHARWAPAMANIEVLAIEKEFTGPLVHPDTGVVSSSFEQTGKIDAVCRIAGEIWLVEHKTSSADLGPTSSYRTRLRMDPQISIYIDGAGMLGHHEVAGCIYDVIGKPGIRPHKATPIESRKYTKGKKCKPCKGAGCEVCGNSGWKEAPRLYAKMRERDETFGEFRDRLVAEVTAKPEKYYQRARVVRLDSELDAARRDLWATGEAITAQAGRHSSRNSDACFRFGGACEYFDVCTGAASLDDPTRFVKRRSRRGQERSAA